MCVLWAHWHQKLTLQNASRRDGICVSMWDVTSLCRHTLCVSPIGSVQIFLQSNNKSWTPLATFPPSPSRQARTTQTEAQMPPLPLMCEIFNTTWEARLWSSWLTRPQRTRINTRWPPIKRQDPEQWAALNKNRIRTKIPKVQKTFNHLNKWNNWNQQNNYYNLD